MQTESDLIRLEFTYQYEDVRDARKVIAKTQKKGEIRYSRMLLGWLMILSVMVLIFVVYHTPASASVAVVHRPLSIGGALGGWWYFIAIPVVSWFIARWPGKGRKAWEKTATHEHTVVELSAAGSLVETGMTRMEVKWHYYERMEEGPTVFVLFHKVTPVVILPKRVMSGEQVAKVRGLLQAHVGKAKGFEVVMEGHAKGVNSD